MVILNIILLVFAFVLVLLSAFGVSHPKVNFSWLGMAFWLLTVLLGAFHV